MGCVAPQTILLDSDPVGAHVEIEGEYIGLTPYEYTFDSPLAEKMWPWKATIVARKAGFLDDTREFKVHDPLPEKIMFVLKADPNATKTQPKPNTNTNKKPPTDFTPIDGLKDDL